MEKTATYQLSTSLKEGIIEVVITGELTSHYTKKLQNEVLAVAKSKNTRTLLVDIRTLKGRFGYVETYNRIRMPNPDERPSRTAAVDVEENTNIRSFHETTAINAGWSMKWFTDIDAARAWLKSRK